MSPRLFRPIRFGGVAFGNRIVVSPMCQYSANGGLPGDWHVQHYGSLASSGPGLLMTEATAVTPEGRITTGCLGLYSTAHEVALARLLAAIRSVADVRVGIQLTHAGRKGSAMPPWDGGRPLTSAEGAWPTISSSNGAFGQGWPDSKPAAASELEGIRNAFAEAAARAVRSGFDVIEVHAAHGYLLHQFLSPISNRRTDDLGGALHNRMRFPLDVIRAVRRAVPDEKAVGMRISATDWLDGGFNPEDAIAFVRAAGELGINYVCVSTGGIASNARIPLGPGYQTHFAAAIKAATNVPVRTVGLITEPEQAEALLEQGVADQVALGRAFLNDPRWVWRAALALGAPFTPPRQYLAARPSAVSPAAVDIPPGTTATTSTMPIAASPPVETRVRARG